MSVIVWFRSDEFIDELAARICAGKQEVGRPFDWSKHSELAKETIWRPQARWIRDWLLEQECG